MSTEDKRDGQDGAAAGPKDNAAADTPETPIEDAEVVSEVDEHGNPVKREPVDDADDATAQTEAAPDAEAQMQDADAPDQTAPVAENASDADPAEQPYSAGTAPDSPAETTAATPPAANDDTPPSGSGAGVLSTVFGGALAAIVGFGAAQFIEVNWMEASGLGSDPVAVALDTNSGAIEALTARLDAVEAAATDTSAVEGVMTGIAADITGRFETLSDEVTGLRSNLDGLADQVVALETGVSDSLTQVDGAVAEANTQVAAVETGLGTVAEALGNVESRMGGIGDRLEGVDARLAEVDARLVEVEKRPLVESSETARAAFEVYERELEELRGTLARQQAEAADMEASMTELAASARAQQTAVQEEAAAQIEAIRDRNEEALAAARLAMQAELAAAAAQIEEAEAAAAARVADAEAQAEARAQAAVARASLSQVEAALNAGIAYEVALPALQAVTEVPAVFVENAATGIPTVAQLQEAYTPAARAALDSSITTTMSGEPGDRVLAFLRTQTGVRSTTAREGDDPDAVLSRMTVAVETGDLATAVSEYGALPEAGQAALADWIAGARARLSAEEALPTLADAVTTN